MHSISHLKICSPKQRPSLSIDENCNELRERKHVVAECVGGVAARNGASSRFLQRSASLADIAWHYTIGIRLISIVNTGALLTTDVLVQPDEHPVLWFSLNPTWEPTANKAMITKEGDFVTLTKDETRQTGGALVRFGYPRSLLLPWNELRRQANIGRKKAKGLEASGYSQGALPAHWMGSLDAIFLDDLIIEVWDGERWNCIQDPSAYHSGVWQRTLREAA